jgi:CheY-like chemotaxis protein
VLSLATALEDQQGLPPGCHDAMRIVRRNVELEARLIDDLLDLTRIARGKLALRLAPVDVHRLLREVLEICEEDLRAKRLRTTVDLRATESTVRADAARLEQVFWNLIKNAVKFTPDGGAVTVATSNAGDGRQLTVRVADTGVGVEPDVLRKIFEPFEQADPSVTRQFGGLGLGLAIGKGIVEAHGGRITAESAGTGAGATFAVELATLPGAKEEQRPPQGKRPARPMRILLVEDHPDTARVMRTLLKGMGHEVVRVTTVRTALDALNREPPFDVMISDIGLPDGTGWDLMKQAGQLRPALRGIALSGYGMEHDIRRSKEAGFEEHIVKPFNFARLTELIDAVCSR